MEERGKNGGKEEERGKTEEKRRKEGVFSSKGRRKEGYENLGGGRRNAEQYPLPYWSILYIEFSEKWNNFKILKK